MRGSPCTGTELGSKLAHHMEDVALLEAQLLPQTASPARLSVAVNADSLATWIIPALAQQSGLLFDITVVDQAHSAQLLKEGRVAAAITTRETPVQGCDSVYLGAVATASPTFVARWFPTGVTAQSLRQAPALIYDHKDSLQRDWAQRETGEDIVLSGHLLPSTHAFVDAAITGLGWGLNPSALVKEPLREGQLVQLGQQSGFETPLFWQISRRLAAPLAGLTSAIRRAADHALVVSKE